MEVKNKNMSSDEMTVAESELLAAQEALRLARLRLEELVAQHPALEPFSLEEKAVITSTTARNREEHETTLLEQEPGAEERSQKCAEVKTASKTTASEQEKSDQEKSDQTPTIRCDEQSRPTKKKDDKSSQHAKTELPTWIPYRASMEDVPSDIAISGNGVGNFSVEPPRGFSAASKPMPPSPNNRSFQTTIAPGSYDHNVSQSAPDHGNASGAQRPCVEAAQPGFGSDAFSPPHVGPGAVPPAQPFYSYQQPYPQQGVYGPQSGVGTKDHVSAGLLAIFLGFLGIHKFYLGYNVSGFIMLGVSILGGILTFSLAALAVWVIAIIEGVLYLTKSQTEFEQIYVVNKREWF